MTYFPLDYQALFLGSEVQSGNVVIRDLTRCGITVWAIFI